jgi:sulfur-carrier protein adenylyltransferase/sulfurtransferase
MSRVYFILSFVLIIVALGLVFLPDVRREKELNPELLLKSIIDPSRFMSVDQLADRLIKEDPSLVLIDVRSNEDFDSYSLPGAVNVSLMNIAQSEMEDILNEDRKEVILFSNDDLYANQAWIICKRLGYKNLFVLKGGLNQWFSDIIQPRPPAEQASQTEIDLYSFRKAASQYFTGSQITSRNEYNEKQIIIKKKDRKTGAEGGC